MKNAMIAIGIGDVDISFSWDNLYAENRKIVDPVANRYFFVPDPVEVKIEGAPHHTANAMLHPSDPGRGSRTLPFEGKALIPRSEIAQCLYCIGNFKECLPFVAQRRRVFAYHGTGSAFGKNICDEVMTIEILARNGKKTIAGFRRS